MTLFYYLKNELINIIDSRINYIYISKITGFIIEIIFAVTALYNEISI